MKTTFLAFIFIIGIHYNLAAQNDGFSEKLSAIQYSLNEGDATESLRLVYDLTDSYPDSSLAWYYRSQVEKQLIQYKKAIESISKAMAIDPGTPSYYYQASSVYSDLQRYDMCVSYCDSVIKVDSTHLFASILKGQALQKDGKIQEALKQYYSLHQRDSLNIYFMKQIGSLYAKIDSLNDAIDWYARAVEVDSTDIPSYTHLGNLFVRTEQYKPGIPILTRAIKMDSLNSWLYRFRGSLNIMGANLEEAEQDFSRAILLGDSTAFTFRHLGLSLYKQSKYEEAFPVYQTTIKLDPEDAQAWYYLAFCYKWKEDVDQAIICMDKSLELSVAPGISSVYSGLAQFYALKREYEFAKEYYAKAYEWDQQDPLPLAQLGMLVEQTGGDKLEAKKYYKAYLEMPGNMDINLKTYIVNRLEIINEKLFMEGRLEKEN